MVKRLKKQGFTVKAWEGVSQKVAKKSHFFKKKTSYCKPWEGDNNMSFVWASFMNAPLCEHISNILTVRKQDLAQLKKYKPK